jgi:acetoacetate decarboxylase
MPDSTGFGDYTESGQVIPVTCDQGKAGHVTPMPCTSTTIRLDRRWPRALGLPQEAGQHRSSAVAQSTRLVGTLDYGPVRVATGYHGLQTPRAWTMAAVLAKASWPARLTICSRSCPHVDGSAAHLRAGVNTFLEGRGPMKGAWTGPAALSAGASTRWRPWRQLPVLEVLSGTQAFPRRSSRSGLGATWCIRLPRLNPARKHAAARAFHRLRLSFTTFTATIARR